MKETKVGFSRADVPLKPLSGVFICHEPETEHQPWDSLPIQMEEIKMNTNPKTVKLTKLAMLGAVSLVLVLLIRVPFPPAPSWFTILQTYPFSSPDSLSGPWPGCL